MKKILAVLFVIIMVLTSSMAFAADETTNVISDAFILRPLGLVTLVAGTAIFIVSLPIAAISRSIDTTSRVLVKEPFEYTFVRPMGQIEYELE